MDMKVKSGQQIKVGDIVIDRKFLLGIVLGRYPNKSNAFYYEVKYLNNKVYTYYKNNVRLATPMEIVLYG